MSTTAFMLIRFHQPCCQDADLGAEVVVFLAEVKRENDSSVPPWFPKKGREWRLSEEAD